jgi:predicted acyltransferase
MVPLEKEKVLTRPVAAVAREPVPPLPARAEKPARLVSLDAYRGFVMLAMASGGLAFAATARKAGFTSPWTGELLGRRFDAWQFLANELDHVAWTGCSFWDLIQPSFMFMVGVALPYSYASRRAKGDSYGRIFVHVLIRSLILIVLGIFLSSNGGRQTNFTFVNVLTQIGLGYAVVFLLLGRGLIVQFLALVAILGGYWFAFFNHPLPPADFPYAFVNAAEEQQHVSGTFAHWNKNANFASDFDRWFLNLFPHSPRLAPEDVTIFAGAPPMGSLGAVPWAGLYYSAQLESHDRFRFNEGGYATLNFIPSIGTMLLGLMAGELLRSRRDPKAKLKYLLLAGVVCLVLGLVLGYTVCPIVKRIWTPSWTVFSAGWTFFMLAAFYWIIDLQGYRRWAFPLVIVGMNSIAMYVMAQLMKPWVRQTLKTHLGPNVFTGGLGPSGQPLLSAVYEPLIASVAVLAVFWLICLSLYRQKIFVRI